VALRAPQSAAGDIVARRTVISVSLSERNADAAVVMQALVERGIDLGHSGGQILRWAAAFLTRPMTPAPAPEGAAMEAFGMSSSDLNALLDDF